MKIKRGRRKTRTMSDIIYDDVSNVGQTTIMTWPSPFDAFPMVSISTIGDGHCFFHAICGASFIPYRTGRINGQPITKLDIVTDLRRSLARRLSQKIDLSNPSSPTYYDLLGNGEVAKLANEGESGKYYSLEEMVGRLNSSQYIGHEYFEFIGEILNLDIYILDGEKKTVYRAADDLSSMYKGRLSVVLLFEREHFDIVGLRMDKGVATTFRSDNIFIEFLNDKLKSKE